MKTAHFPSPDTWVTCEWLQSHLDDPDLVVLDCTVGVDFEPDGTFHIFSGREDYDIYRGGGVAAGSAVFVLHRMGYRDAAVYAASLQRWLADRANLVETDPVLEVDA